MEDRQALLDAIGRQRTIERPRLTRMLDESRARIRMLVAPAGYGKTTLARQWLAHRPHAWYRGTSASADVAALALGLAACLGAVLPGAGQRMANRLRATGTPEEDVDVLAEMLAEDLAEWPEDAWLAIDDYQRLADSTHSVRFVDHLVSLTSVPLLLTSRFRPTWATPRRMLYGEIKEVDAALLAMTSDEALEVLGDARGATGLATLADGWPAVIGLAAASKNAHPPEGTFASNLHDYFAEELYQAVPPAVQWGLAQLSLVPTLTADLAEGVLGAGASDVLATGIRLGFLKAQSTDQLDSHPLLRTFLGTKLRQAPPEALAASTLKMGKCLIERARWDDAFDVVSTFFSEVVFVDLVDLAFPHLLKDARLPTLDKWVTFAATKRVNTPLLHLAEAEICFRRGQRKRAERLACRAAQTLPTDHPSRVSAFLLAGRSAHLEGDDEQAVAHYLEAHNVATNEDDRWEALAGRLIASTVLESDDAQEQFEYLESLNDGRPDREITSATVHFGWQSRLVGFRGLTAALAEVEILIERVEDPVRAAAYLYAVTQSLISDGRYRDARSAISRTIDYVNRERLPFVLPYLKNTSARAELGLRNFGRALQILPRAREGLTSTTSSYLRGEFLAAEARIFLSQGLHERAIELLDEAQDHLVTRGERGEHLACRALTLAGFGDAHEAHDLIKRARNETRSPHVQVLAPCVEAIAALRTGQPDADGLSIAAFDTVLDVGDIDGFVLAYRVHPDLAGQVARGSHQRELASILWNARDEKIARRIGVRYPRAQRARDGILSPREREVLALLAQGLTNRQIAGAMYIQESTAKLHLRHIFEKLDAKTRVEAIAKARIMGLLS